MQALLWCSRKMLVSISFKILSNTRSFYDDFVGFSWGSWTEDLGQGLLHSLWEVPVGILVILAWSCKSPWEDLVKILLKSSSRGPCIKILNILCFGLLWCLCESSFGMFIRSSWLKILWDPVIIPRRSFFDNLLAFSRCSGLRFWYAVLTSRHASYTKTKSCTCSSDDVCLTWYVTVP